MDSLLNRNKQVYDVGYLPQLLKIDKKKVLYNNQGILKGDTCISIPSELHKNSNQLKHTYISLSMQTPDNIDNAILRYKSEDVVMGEFNFKIKNTTEKSIELNIPISTQYYWFKREVDKICISIPGKDALINTVQIVKPLENED